MAIVWNKSGVVDDLAGQGSPVANRHIRPLRSVHTVTPGETLNTVAAMHGLEPNELIQLNSHAIGTGGIIHPGMRLEI
jgi:LysM repeat protein